uniref:Uncharacterized protein n=1 Tax=Anguilla anguilla TaxID=7936 RepID=A0A0E9P9M4_ANGAN
MAWCSCQCNYQDLSRCYTLWDFCVFMLSHIFHWIMVAILFEYKCFPC